MLSKLFNEKQKEKIELYKNALHEWHNELHLVSDNALKDIDTYILDCAHLWSFIKDSPYIIDVGSGNGLPGAILGIMGASGLLVDSHKRKAIFLRKIVDELDLNLKIIDHSIRNIEKADEKWILTRGFGKIDKCLDATVKLWNSQNRGLFIKSKNVQEEIDSALTKGWKFEYNIHNRHMPGTIVEIWNVKYIR